MSSSLSAYMSVYLPVRHPACIGPPCNLPFICLSVSLFSLLVCFSLNVTVCAPVYLSFSLSVCLSSVLYSQPNLSSQSHFSLFLPKRLGINNNARQAVNVNRLGRRDGAKEGIHFLLASLRRAERERTGETPRRWVSSRPTASNGPGSGLRVKPGTQRTRRKKKKKKPGTQRRWVSSQLPRKVLETVGESNQGRMPRKWVSSRRTAPNGPWSGTLVAC